MSDLDKEITEDDSSRASYIGAPAVFALEMACRSIADAFQGFGIYHVGSSLHRASWRDVDLRLIMADEEFEKEFPGAGPVKNCRWEFDAKWLLLTVSISEHLSRITGLPIDFQFQPQSHANSRHKKPRNAIGMRLARNDD